MLRKKYNLLSGGGRGIKKIEIIYNLVVQLHEKIILLPHLVWWAAKLEALQTRDFLNILLLLRSNNLAV